MNYAMYVGYLASIFSHWDGYTRPRQIIGATRNPLIISLVNSLGKYQIRYESEAYLQVIPNVQMIDMNDETAMLAMYEKSQIIGLALPESAIRFQAEMIARGLMARYEAGGSDLTILIVMNKVGAAKFVKKHIRTALKNFTTEKDVKQIISHTNFIETVVNRMVLPVPEEFLLSKLKNDLYMLHHNVSGIFEHIDKLTSFFANYPIKIESGRNKKKTKNMRDTTPASVSISENLSSLSFLSNAISQVTAALFISEPDMPLYAASGSGIVEQLRQVVIVQDISSMQTIKNKLSNGTHAIIAWYSKLLQYKTIGQGMGDPRVSELARNIMKHEIKPALLLENQEYAMYINAFISSFMVRCRNSFKDSCSRVGRDVMRKLQQDERIIGAIKMARQHGLPSDGLEFGAACAILSCVVETKSSNSESAKVKNLYEMNHSVSDVLAYDGEYNNGRYNGLDRGADEELIARIQVKFDALKADLYAI